MAARVVSGRRHRCPILYELIDEAVRAVGRDVIQVLIVDRGFIDGAQMGRLQQDYRIETIVPVRANLDLHADAIRLTRLRDFRGEPYICSLPARPQTWLGVGRGLLSWSQCLAPLTAVVNREPDQHGQLRDWVLVSTSPRRTAAVIRSTYDLRPAIEERHRQYKCFRDLTRMHSCAFALVVNQILFVLLAYTLVQAHLVLRQRQELDRGTRDQLWRLLSPTLEVAAVYYRQRFCLLTLAEFARWLLQITEPARGKLLEKIRSMEKGLCSLLENARPP